MDSNGLEIGESQFVEMTGKQQNLILFQNILQINSKLTDYKVTKKVQYWWLSALTMIFFGYFSFKSKLGLI